MAKKKKKAVKQPGGAESQARRVLELAQQHLQKVLKAHRENPVERRVPAAHIKGVDRVTIRNPKTPGQAKLAEMERHGFDIGAGRYFRTQWEREAYRKRKGLVEMSAKEFEQEVGDAPSPASEPYYSYWDRVFGPVELPPDVPRPEIRIERLRPEGGEENRT